MTTHQDTSSERDLVARMRSLEVDHEPDGWPAVRMKEVSALCYEIERLRAALASRDEGADAPADFDAWWQTDGPNTVSAYDAAKSAWYASKQPQGQAVSDEQIDAALRDIDHVARDYEVYDEYGLPVHLLDGADFPDYKDVAEGMRQPIRAILALRDKPEQRVPLSDDFATIAGLESAVGHLSTLVDEQRALLVESEDVFGRDGHGGRYEDGECNLIDRIRAHLEMTAPPQNGITAKDGA